MSKQTVTGRIGRIRNRIQFLNPRTKHWTEINTKAGGIMNVKADKKPFKAVRHVKTK